MKQEEIMKIIRKHNSDRSGLIAALFEIQSKYSYLPDTALSAVAESTGRSLVEVYGVATFYKSFSLKPRGRRLISVCLGTACHVRSAPVIAEEFERRLGIKAGETTEDKEFTLETVNCLGACALGPIVVVDGRYFSNVDANRVGQILKKARAGLNGAAGEKGQQVFPVRASCPRCNRCLMDDQHPIDGQPSICVTVSFGRKHGRLRLSSIYGSYKIEPEHEMPPGAVVNFFCPHCHAEIIGASNCTACSAPLIPMIVAGGGMVQICSRRGCKEHMLDLSGVNF